MPDEILHFKDSNPNFYTELNHSSNGQTLVQIEPHCNKYKIDNYCLKIMSFYVRSYLKNIDWFLSAIQPSL